MSNRKTRRARASKAREVIIIKVQLSLPDQARTLIYDRHRQYAVEEETSDFIRNMMQGDFKRYYKARVAIDPINESVAFEFIERAPEQGW